MAVPHLPCSDKAVQRPSKRPWATPTSLISEKGASGHVTGVLWTPPTPIARLLQHSSAIDVPLGFTTDLQPFFWSSSLEDRLPVEFLGQGTAFSAQRAPQPPSAGHECRAKLSTAAEMLRYPSSACSLHGACNIPRFHTFPHPDVPNRQTGTLPRHPNKYIPALVSAPTSLIFRLSLPTHCKQVAASDRPCGATRKVDLKDVR